MSLTASWNPKLSPIQNCCQHVCSTYQVQLRRQSSHHLKMCKFVNCSVLCLILLFTFMPWIIYLEVVLNWFTIIIFFLLFWIIYYLAKKKDNTFLTNLENAQKRNAVKYYLLLNETQSFPNRPKIKNRLDVWFILKSLTRNLLTFNPYSLVAIGFERYLDPKHRTIDVGRRSTKMIEAIGYTTQNIVIAKTAEQVFNRIMNIRRKTPEDQAPNVIYVSFYCCYCGSWEIYMIMGKKKGVILVIHHDHNIILHELPNTVVGLSPWMRCCSVHWWTLLLSAKFLPAASTILSPYPIPFVAPPLLVLHGVSCGEIPSASFRLSFPPPWNRIL